MKKIITLFLMVFCIYFIDAQIVTEWNQKFNYSTEANLRTFKFNIDSQGKIYISSVFEVNGQYVLSVLKYDETGEMLWQTDYSIGSSFSRLVKMLCTPNGEISVYFYGSGNLYLNKYSQSGSLLSDNSLISSLENISRILIDDTSAYFVKTTQPYEEEPDMTDIHLIKMDFSGNLVWEDVYSMSYDTGFRFDNDGNLLLLGRNHLEYYTNANGVEGDIRNDVFVKKVSTNGIEIWHKTINMETDSFENIFGGVVDADNNIYCTYSNQNYIEYSPPLLYKLTENGAVAWYKTFTHPLYDVHNKFEHILANLPYVYITGRSEVPYESNILTVSFNEQGNALWHANNFTNSDILGYGSFSKIDASGNIFSFGYGIVSSEESDVFFNVYDSNGNLLEAIDYNSTGSSREVVKDVIMYGNSIYVLASSDSKIMLVKFSNHFVNGIPEYKTIGLSLYPNPCREWFEINTLENVPPESLDLQINNMLNETVYFQKISSSENRIYHHLPRGLYVIIIKNEEMELYRGKMLVD